MVKKNDTPRVRYEPPKAEVFVLCEPLNVLQGFSVNGKGQDWEFSDAWWELEDERNLGTNDWGGFGDLGNDTD